MYVYTVYTHVRCYHYHTAWAPEGREGQSQAGPKGHKLEVGARRAPKLLVCSYEHMPNQGTADNWSDPASSSDEPDEARWCGKTLLSCHNQLYVSFYDFDVVEF